MFFTMLKMPNRWLQWFQNIQKSLSGLFRHLVWPKIEEDRLPGSSPSNLLSLDRQNAPLRPQPSLYAHICVKTYHRVQPQNSANYRTVRVHLAPNRQNRGHMGHHVTAPAHKKGQGLKHMVMCQVSSAWGLNACRHSSGYMVVIYVTGSWGLALAQTAPHSTLNSIQIIFKSFIC
jgi:hypothetical protein